MKKIVGLVACLAISACACDQNQWEEVDNVTFDETEYVTAPVVEEQSETVVTPQPVYVPAPQVVYDAPCAEVQATPCGCQSACMQPCGCQQMVAPQPKVTKTRKIITTTTTLEEPCGKAVCEPIITTHEEIVPVEEEVIVPSVAETAPKAEVKEETKGDYVDITVQKAPYGEEKVVAMQKSSAKVANGIAVKYSPEVYNVVATRATNRMLQDTSAIYDNGKTRTVYVEDTELKSSDLPYGSHRLKGATKDLISGSNTFDVVNNSKDADFIIKTSADWYVSSNNATPALQYTLSLEDKNGKQVNEWVEVIRQVKE